MQPQQNEEFGKRVEAVLDERGLSQRNAANRCGIDRLTLANMIDGVVPRLELVEQFARTFHLDVNEWRELAGYPRVEEKSPDILLDQLLDHEEAEAQELAYEPDLSGVGVDLLTGGSEISPKDQRTLKRLLLRARQRQLARQGLKVEGVDCE